MNTHPRSIGSHSTSIPLPLHSSIICTVYIHMICVRIFVKTSHLPAWDTRSTTKTPFRSISPSFVYQFYVGDFIQKALYVIQKKETYTTFDEHNSFMGLAIMTSLLFFIELYSVKETQIQRNASFLDYGSSIPYKKPFPHSRSPHLQIRKTLKVIL